MKAHSFTQSVKTALDGYLDAVEGRNNPKEAELVKLLQENVTVLAQKIMTENGQPVLTTRRPYSQVESIALAILDTLISCASQSTYTFHYVDVTFLAQDVLMHLGGVKAWDSC